MDKMSEMDVCNVQLPCWIHQNIHKMYYLNMLVSFIGGEQKIEKQSIQWKYYYVYLCVYVYACGVCFM